MKRTAPNNVESALEAVTLHLTRYDVPNWDGAIEALRRWRDVANGRFPTNVLDTAVAELERFGVKQRNVNTLEKIGILYCRQVFQREWWPEELPANFGPASLTELVLALQALQDLVRDGHEMNRIIRNESDYREFIRSVRNEFGQHAVVRQQQRPAMFPFQAKALNTCDGVWIVFFSQAEAEELTTACNS